MEIDQTHYRYSDSELGCLQEYLYPVVCRVLGELPLESKRVFDLGCGNGSFGNKLSQLGFAVAGVDPSESGIAFGKENFPALNLQVGSAYDNLQTIFGTFPAVVSLEVVEHVYYPRKYAASIRALLEPGGYALISTPYHGYLKNLALAISGKMDQHFTALWDHGHIKFWSEKTLTALLEEAGLEVKRIHRIGRIPQLAKSMLAVVQRN